MTVKTVDGERTIEGSDLMAAVGRIPNTADIGLDKAGVQLDAQAQARQRDVESCLSMTSNVRMSIFAL